MQNSQPREHDSPRQVLLSGSDYNSLPSEACTNNRVWAEGVKVSIQRPSRIVNVPPHVVC